MGQGEVVMANRKVGACCKHLELTDTSGQPLAREERSKKWPLGGQPAALALRAKGTTEASRPKRIACT